MPIHITVQKLLGGMTALFLCFFLLGTAQSQDWQTIIDGMDIAWFSANDSLPENDSLITIVRVDPQKYEILFRSITETGDEKGLTAKGWCEKEQLILATNGGMFDEDYITHIGYMKSGNHINSSRRNSYKSALAYKPNVEGLPLFRLYDLDEIDLDSIISQYDLVMQNLRLIKRPRENRWSPKKRRWTEAALAEDSAGNALFILCRQPISMYDFNERLLSLPLGIVAAQHLEGGLETQLYLKVANLELSLSSHQNTQTAKEDKLLLFRLPNIIGVRAKE